MRDQAEALAAERTDATVAAALHGMLRDAFQVAANKITDRVNSEFTAQLVVEQAKLIAEKDAKIAELEAAIREIDRRRCMTAPNSTYLAGAIQDAMTLVDGGGDE